MVDPIGLTDFCVDLPRRTALVSSSGFWSQRPYRERVQPLPTYQYSISDDLEVFSLRRHRSVWIRERQFYKGFELANRAAGARQETRRLFGTFGSIARRGIGHPWELPGAWILGKVKRGARSQGPKVASRSVQQVHPPTTGWRRLSIVRLTGSGHAMVTDRWDSASLTKESVHEERRPSPGGQALFRGVLAPDFARETLNLGAGPADAILQKPPRIRRTTSLMPKTDQQTGQGLDRIRRSRGRSLHGGGEEVHNGLPDHHRVESVPHLS